MLRECATASRQPADFAGHERQRRGHVDRVTGFRRFHGGNFFHALLISDRTYVGGSRLWFRVDLDGWTGGFALGFGHSRGGDRSEFVVAAK